MASESAASNLDAAAMLDLLPELVNRFRVDDLTIVYCNAAWAVQYQVAAADAIGRSLVDFLSADDVIGLHDQLSRLSVEKPVAVDIVARAAPGDTEQFIEWVDRYIEAENGAEVLSVGRDVTARIQAEALLAVSEQRFRQLADHSSDVVWRFSTEPILRLEYISPSVEAVLGFLPQHFTDDYTRLFDLLEPDDISTVQRMLSGEVMPNRFDSRLRRSDGRVVTVETQSTVLADGLQGVSRDVSELRELQARLSEMALRDPLTGLANRRLVNELLEAAVARTKRSGLPLAVAFLDVDGLKAVNDSYGHDAGDAVLRETARRLLEAVRSADVVGRIGGDEFVVVFEPGSIEPIEVERRIDTALSQPISLGGGVEVVCPASIGIADTRSVAADPTELLAAADLAMYAAKRARRRQHG